MRSLRVPPIHRMPLGGITISHLLPNMVTALALCAGMTAMRFAVQGKFEHAVAAILIAAVLDALDGRVARFLNAQSKFGAELDSLSDAIAFGVAPAWVIYLWVLQEGGTLGWIAALTHAVCCALRLARFNSRLGAPDLPPWAYRFFTGVPAPAGAAVALLPVVATFDEVGLTFLHSSYVLIPWLFISGGLMISRLPTFSFKGVRIAHHFIIPILLVTVLLAAALASQPWLTLFIMGIVYVATLPVSFAQFRKLQKTTAEKGVQSVPDFADEPLQVVKLDD